MHNYHVNVYYGNSQVPAATFHFSTKECAIAFMLSSRYNGTVKMVKA
jgi:hypothetical protein